MDLPRRIVLRLWKGVKPTDPHFGTVMLVGCLLGDVLYGVKFSLQSHRYPDSATLITEDSVFLLAVIVGLTLTARRARRLALLVAWLMIVLGCLIVQFADLYWDYGTKRNFTQTLTHLDALYVAVGTLATAGSGTISSTSQATRAIQTVQMALDTGFVVFAVTIVVTRLVENRTR